MGLTKDNIISVCSDYFNSDEPQYAILVNGEWGEGKTYFWKNTLEAQAKKQGLKTVYISLNGIENVRSINELLFIGVIPLIGAKDQSRIRSAFRFVTNSINGVSKYFFKSGISELFHGVGLESIDFTSYLFCFDDLERCEVSTTKVLGLINNIVEHRGGKAIILGNEPEIQAKDKEYSRIKEKTIGISLRYSIDISEIVSDKIASYKSMDNEFFDLIEPHQDYILSLLNEYSVLNIRTLDFYFHILDSVRTHLYNLDSSIIKEVILFSLLISIEFKSGVLRSSDIDDCKELDQISYQSMALRKMLYTDKSESEENEEGYYHLFYKKFLVSRLGEFQFYRSLYRFILSGYFDSVMFREELAERIPPDVSIEAKAFRKLITYDFRRLSNLEFKDLSRKVQDYALEGRYSLFDYTALAKFYAFFLDNNLLDFSEENVRESILKGIEINRNNRRGDKEILKNIERFSEPTGFEREIYETVKVIVNEWEGESELEKSEALIELLRIENRERLTEDLALKKFEMTYFHLVDMSELARVILQSSNDFLVYLRELFEDRYSGGNLSYFLPKDKDPLFELVRSLKNQLNTEDVGQPKKMIALELIDSLSMIVRDKYR